MIVNHNKTAVLTDRHFQFFTQKTKENVERLASGMKINRAADDSAGLTVSEKMRSQIKGLNQANQIVQNNISLIQNANIWLNEIQSMLQRMREVAVKAANGFYTYEDRTHMNTEIKQLVDEIDRIASNAELSRIRYLRGGFRREPHAADYARGIDPQKTWDVAKAKTMTNPPVRPIDPITKDPSEHPLMRSVESGEQEPYGGFFVHVGANTDERERIYIENMSAYALGLAAEEPVEDASNRRLHVSFTSSDGANHAIAQIDSALYIVSRQRADLGVYENKLGHTIRGIDSSVVSLQAAESHIRDVDMAKEMIDYLKNQLMSDNSVSMFVKANMNTNNILTVLG